MSCITTFPKGTDYGKDFFGSLLSKKILYASIQPYIDAYGNINETDIVGIYKYVMTSFYFKV